MSVILVIFIWFWFVFLLLCCCCCCCCRPYGRYIRKICVGYIGHGRLWWPPSLSSLVHVACCVGFCCQSAWVGNYSDGMIWFAPTVSQDMPDGWRSAHLALGHLGSSLNRIRVEPSIHTISEMTLPLSSPSLFEILYKRRTKTSIEFQQ